MKGAAHRFEPHCSRRRQNRSRSHVGALLLSAAIALTGCSFGKEEEAPAEVNSCTVDADCSTQRCESGRCVSEVQTPMQVTVVVTPKSTANGLLAQPIVGEAFTLAGGSQTIGLRKPVSVRVRVLSNGKLIPAQASFTPVDNKNRFTDKIAMLPVLAPDKDGTEPSNRTMLFEGMEYRVLIQPSEADLPAHSELFTAQADASLEIDYDKLAAKTKTKTFGIRNAARVAYQVRAVAEATGAPISNSDTFTGSLAGSGSISLKFDDADAAYRLEFTPADQKAYSTGTAGSCGDDAPQPKVTVPSRLFSPDPTSSSKWIVELPELYPAVEYSGVVELCSNQKVTSALQMTLKTADLYLASGNSDLIQGEYETAAAATWDDNINKFRFCARVPPGAYTVKVMPSPSLNCEVFAEKRVLRPSLDGDEDVLSLRMPAMLTANVLTPERMPMPKATVDVLALPAAGDVMLAPDDPSVANYNRSGSISTGMDGSFSVSVDRGRYDVFIKPPEASNYAWRVIYDVAVAASNAEFATEIMLNAPVAVTGQLQYINGDAGDQQSLADAEVRAYTLVSVDGQGEQRSVEIGSGHANANGVVTLLLPPALQHSWNP